MFRTILVPTDGSPLSERALPAAIEIAHAQDAELRFVRVVQWLQWMDMGPEGYMSADVYDQVMEALDQDAQQSLDRAVAAAQTSGVRASAARLHGFPIPAVLDYEAEHQPDLVVMATHGRTGLARFARGSVADAVVREGTAPVLLIHSFGDEAGPMKRAVVPLDGSAVAEEAIPIVEALAGQPLAHVHLVQATRAAEDVPVAREYLMRIAERLATSRLEVSTGVAAGEPHWVISEAAKDGDLVIMATHGRGGVDRLRHGSVATQALHELTVPLLLVRAAGSRAAVPAQLELAAASA